MWLNFLLVAWLRGAAELTEASRPGLPEPVRACIGPCPALTGDRQWLQLKALGVLVPKQGAPPENSSESEAGLWKNRCRHKFWVPHCKLIHTSNWEQKVLPVPAWDNGQ